MTSRPGGVILRLWTQDESHDLLVHRAVNGGEVFNRVEARGLILSSRLPIRGDPDCETGLGEQRANGLEIHRGLGDQIEVMADLLATVPYRRVIATAQDGPYFWEREARLFTQEVHREVTRDDVLLVTRFSLKGGQGHFEMLANGLENRVSGNGLSLLIGKQAFYCVEGECRG